LEENKVPIEPNLRNIIPAISFNGLTPAKVSELVKYAPTYKHNEYKRLVEDAVGAIHQIPRIFQASRGKPYDLKNIVAYFGRSSAGPYELGSNIYQRFMTGKRDRGDIFGLVFARTTIKASTNFERWGIRLIEILKEQNGLCISNKTRHAGGSKGKTEPGFLYMTFHYEDVNEPGFVLTQSEIDEAVIEIMNGYSEQSRTKTICQEGSSAGVTLANNVTFTGSKPIQLFIPKKM
jgi:hypothetical protein